jgi:hypothetical protein
MNFNEKIIFLEQNMIKKFSYLPSLIYGMRVDKLNSSIIINSKLTSDMFNIICDTTTNELSLLKKTIDTFHYEKLPFAWWIGFNDEPPDLQEQLIKLGLKCTESEFGMSISLNILPKKVIRDNTYIAQVNSFHIMNDFISVITEQIKSDIKPISDFYIAAQEIIFNSKCSQKLYVGYMNDTPVTIGALFIDNNIAGVWDIITSTYARSKGMATMMTLHILYEGKKLGCTYGVLTASKEGQSVYGKIGFENLKNFYVYN